MLLCIPLARAADDSSGGSAKASEVDKCFVEGAAVQNMFEVKLSEAAVQQASDEQVKKFAQQMIDDHKKASDQNKQVADKIGAQIASDLPPMKQRKIDAIKSQQGKDFDQAYLSCMKAAHLHDVSEFADQAQISKNHDVKQFAQQLLPTLQQHQQQVISLAIAQGLPNPGNQAQPAGATISPSGSDQSQQDKSGSSSSGSGSSDSKTSGSSGDTRSR
jgi:putative membrane protein